MRSDLNLSKSKIQIVRTFLSTIHSVTAARHFHQRILAIKIGNRSSAMLALLTVLSLFGVASAFLFGFGQRFPVVSKSNFLKFSAPPSKSFSTPAERLDLSKLYDLLRFSKLQEARKPVNAIVFPAIDQSPFLIAKYPTANRTLENVLGGLSEVADIDYLNSLPLKDPRRRLLGITQDPGPERRAELNENLQAIDAERGDAAKKVSTYSVYQKLSRKSIDDNLVSMLNIAIERETLRRQRPEYSEYYNPEWSTVVDGAEELQQFIKTCYEDTEHGIVCKHPCLFVYYPYYKAGEPPRNYTIAELYSMNTNMGVSRKLLNTYFANVIYPAIAESPIIAEKYPNPADRTPHKLLGGLANIISIEYMQSLEPHDPRRLFLDTLTAPDEPRCIELERNVVLVDRAVAERKKYEPGAFSIRHRLFQLVRDALEENYSSTLTSAALGENLRRDGSNNGAEMEDAYGDIVKKSYF